MLHQTTDYTFLINWIRNISQNADERVESEPTLDNMCYCSEEKFKSMLEKGFDINQQNEDGTSLLGFLMTRNKFEKIDVLLGFNPDASLVNINGQNIYFNIMAILKSNESFELIEKLLSLDMNGDLVHKSDFNGITPLQRIQNDLDQCESYHGLHDGSISPLDIMVYDDLIHRLRQLKIRFTNHINRKTTLFSFMLQHLYE